MGVEECKANRPLLFMIIIFATTYKYSMEIP